jgi:hypothetical protein
MVPTHEIYDLFYILNLYFTFNKKLSIHKWQFKIIIHCYSIILFKNSILFLDYFLYFFGVISFMKNLSF